MLYYDTVKYNINIGVKYTITPSTIADLIDENNKFAAIISSQYNGKSYNRTQNTMNQTLKDNQII